MENCKMSGKNQGIFRWMISGNPVKEFAPLWANSFKIRHLHGRVQLYR